MMSARTEKTTDNFANGYNCAQSVLCAFCEESGLDTDTAFRLANGLGGGVRCGEKPGILNGERHFYGCRIRWTIEI